MSFETFALGLIGLTLVLIVLHLIARRGTSAGRRVSFRHDGLLGVLALLAVVGTVLVLGATGLWPRLSAGRALGSYGLMLHVGAGGAFIIALALLTALWGGRHHAGGPTGCGRRVLFWLLGAAGLGAALTMLFSMTPLFGTRVQHLLFGWHRVLGVVVLASAVGYAYLAATGRRGDSSVEPGSTV